MADGKVTVKVVRSKSLRRKLQFVGTAYQIASNSPELSELLLKRIRNRFNQQIDSKGRSWPAYSEHSTPRTQMLRNTSSLFDSIKRANSTSGFSLNTSAGFRITADAKNKDGDLYGLYINFGTSKMKAREFLGVSKLDERAVVRKFKQILDKKALTL